jgi:DNA-binding XRE family transcriptional regulator
MTDNVTEWEHIYRQVVTEIAQNRKSAKMSQQAMAELIGCSRRRVNEIESLKVEDWRTVLTIADRMSISVTYCVEVF